MKEKDVDDVVEEQILTIKLKAEDSSKKLMKYKLKITNSDDKSYKLAYSEIINLANTFSLQDDYDVADVAAFFFVLSCPLVIKLLAPPLTRRLQPPHSD
ncbi:hypothetical protein Tco_1437767 [Tanacetum coccineum]